MNLRDITAGYRAFRRETLEALDFNAVDSVGYGFQVDMTFRVAQLGKKIVEVPITFVERELGVSKMSGNIVVEAMLNVTKWGLGARWKKLTGTQVASMPARSAVNDHMARARMDNPFGPSPFVKPAGCQALAAAWAAPRVARNLSRRSFRIVSSSSTERRSSSMSQWVRTGFSLDVFRLLRH